MEDHPSLSYQEFQEFSSQVVSEQGVSINWFRKFVDFIEGLVDKLPFEIPESIIDTFSGSLGLVVLILLLLVFIVIPTIIFLVKNKPVWGRINENFSREEKEESLESRMAGAYIVFRKGNYHKALVTIYGCMIDYLTVYHGFFTGSWWSHRQLIQLVKEKSPENLQFVTRVLSLFNRVVFAHESFNDKEFDQIHKELMSRIKDSHR